MVLTSNTLTSRPSNLDICADNVTHASLSYDPAQNSDGSYDCGTAGPSAKLASDQQAFDVQFQSVPTEFALGQNYPNPFNPTTMIDFAVPETAHVTLKVYNMLGQEVATLANEMRQVGVHTVSFDGSGLSNGVYLYVMEAGAFTVTRRLTLMK